MTEDGPVIELAEFAKALRARGSLERLLGAWGWFLRAEVAVQPSGEVFVLAITTVACSSDVRRDIHVCIPSHVNGVPVERRSRNATSEHRVAAAREGEPAR